MKPKFLAAKLALVIAVSSTLAVTPVQAGIPVIDGTNLSQNIMTAIESVAQTLKQIEQYSTQRRPRISGIRRNRPSTG